MAFFEIEPFGEIVEDGRFARLMCLIANINRDPKKSRKFSPKDFMPSYAKIVQTWQEQLRIVEALNVAFGGKDLRNKNG